MDFILSREQCREVDRLAIEEYGMSSLVLMENAGRGCADVLCELGIESPVVIVCGKGNNGGDGFVIARHLEIRGKDVRVLLLASIKELSGDGRVNCEVLRHTNVPVYELSESKGGIDAWLSEHGSGGGWLVDAMLGTGATGSPRPPFDAAIEWFNRQVARKLAVDVPSGLDCDTGEASRSAVRADVTCTFVALKPGYNSASAAQHTGEIRVLDIGAPRALLDRVVRQNGR
jgi:NAD(P)H-hydrate epimerase